MPTQHFLDQAQSDNQTDPFLLLLTISHADLPEPLRFVRNYEDVVSSGETFTRYPFDFAPPTQSQDGTTSPARILIDNVDQRIVETIRSLSGSPTMLVELIVASSPDAAEETFPLFKLSSVTGDRYQISGDLIASSDEGEPLSRWSFTPSIAPALFR